MSGLAGRGRELKLQVLGYYNNRAVVFFSHDRAILEFRYGMSLEPRQRPAPHARVDIRELFLDAANRVRHGFRKSSGWLGTERPPGPQVHYFTASSEVTARS